MSEEQTTSRGYVIDPPDSTREIRLEKHKVNLWLSREDVEKLLAMFEDQDE